MIATVILSVLIFGAFFYIVYTRFIKRSKGHCDSCHDQGCPLVDVHKINAKQFNSRFHSETGCFLRQLFRLVSKKLYIVRASDILYL